MAKLPNRNTTKGLMDRRLMAREFGRPYLGMSGTGVACLAQRWFDFHWVSKKYIPARTQRIFDVGHSFEKIAIADLKAVGVKVFKMENGKRVEMTGALEEDQETLMGFFGHVSGHSDGRAEGFIEFPDIEMLLELKTMKEQYFILLKKNGVRESQPVYYAQIQRYMREKKLKKCFFLAINKNTCEYYTEFIDFDKGFAEDLVRRENSIIMSDSPMQKEYIEGYYKCFNCNHNKICHQGAEPEMNCRTCKFSNIETEGRWSCENKKSIRARAITLDFEDHSMFEDGNMQLEFDDNYFLSTDEQKVGCDFYVKGWGL
jgi:hypothetical protein